MSVVQPPAKKQIRFSASRVKSLLTCSYAFYCKEVLMLPEKVWGRTFVGSCVHSILECLCNPRHKKHYDAIVDKMAKKVAYEKSPVIARFIRIYQWKNPLMTDEMVADINKMLKVALLDTDFFFEGAIKVFEPEFKFEFKVGEATIKGFLDRCAEYPDKIIVRDYKSQRNKFTQDELDENIQALIYQYVMTLNYNKPTEMQFVLLRHGPKKNDPLNHLQIVPPPPPEAFEGLKLYIQDIYEKLNGFSYEMACSRLCEDKGFCQRVCSFHKPFQYWAVREKANGDIASGHYFDKPPTNIDTTKQFIALEQWKGCPFRYFESPEMS
jgi:hypothetical protein